MDEIESLGKYLKKERETRKISLKEVSKKIKVREHFLRAVEEDRFDLLPSSTYVKGFLSAYAKYVGLDPNAVVLQYESYLKRETVARQEVSPEKKILWNRKYLWMIGAVIAVSLIVFYFSLPSKRRMEPISPKPEVQKTLPPVPPFPVVGKPSVPEEKPIFLKLKAIEETWVRIQVNGQPEQEMTLKPGELTSHRGLSRIHLLVGNAGGLSLILNEKSLEKMGKSGEVVTVIITSKGVEVKRAEKEKAP